MNVLDSSFLCLDIGTTAVRGIAHRVRAARIVRSAIHSVDSTDTVFALKAVIDELERQIGGHFDSAFVTGNFGPMTFDMSVQNTRWGTEHRITPGDVRAQIGKIKAPDGYYPIHIVPLRYDGNAEKNMSTPVSRIETQLTSVFGVIFYDNARLAQIYGYLRRAHIQAAGFFDPQFLLNFTLRARHENTLFIDLGGAHATGALWTDRGVVWMYKTRTGGNEITRRIADDLGIDADDAERIKRSAMTAFPRDMDRFTPADPAYDFSRADIGDIAMPAMTEILDEIRAAAAAAIAKYHPAKIILSGGGSDTDGIADYIADIFGIGVQTVGPDAAVRALGDYVWGTQAAHVRAYQARRDAIAQIGTRLARLWRPRRRRAQSIPILPSTLAFNMRSSQTYALFRAGGISMIHVDIMDGFFVNRVAGGIDELKYIRAHTRAHLYVHLMTESPGVWAADAADAGADTIVVSGGTAGVRAAITEIHRRGRRAGIALAPDMAVAVLKPILREIDDVLVMSVRPGAGGQEFIPDALRKIRTLAATRRKYNLGFRITVDGGINDKTAQLCWDAGADALVAGSYLAHSADFPLAVQSLLKKHE